MELELGLPLIPLAHINPMKGSDRNGNGFQPNEKECCSLGRKFGHGNNYYQRSFEAAFFEEEEAGDNRNAKSSLLCWNGQPNEDGEEERKGTSFTTDMNVEEEEEAENHVVGWPPIKSQRKKLLHRQHGGRRIMKDPTVERGSHGSIGRKIDLHELSHSSQTLSDTLISMFGSCTC